MKNCNIEVRRILLNLELAKKPIGTRRQSILCVQGQPHEDEVPVTTCGQPVSHLL